MMILADKILRLRKQAGWSQEELAEKLGVSRQSVSKWESTSSIPDLNKIIMLAELFEVSTDFLLKDEVEQSELSRTGSEFKAVQINLEQAIGYVKNKVAAASLIAKGVMLCVGSAIPLFTLLAIRASGQFEISGKMVAIVGLLLLLLMVAVGISFFIRTNQFETDVSIIDEGEFELAYGVRGALNDQLNKFKSSYNLRLSAGIALFVFCSVPFMFSLILGAESTTILLMIDVSILILMIGLWIVIPASAKFEAYTKILCEDDPNSAKSQRIRRVEKLAAFYWPLLVAVYLGWSLWTMNWGVTWIIWPVGAVLFAASVGLMELRQKDSN